MGDCKRIEADKRRISAIACTARAGVAIALCALALTASAALYKWTDANGRVVYSDQPPPAGSNATAEVLRAPPPPANPHAVKEMAQKDVDLKKRQAERAEEAKKGDKAKVEADRRADTCTQLRGQAKMLASEDELLYKFDEKGERVYMDDAAKKKELERIQGLVRENNCPRG